MRILLVEDDEVLGDALRSGLTLEGFAVDWLQDGNHAIHTLRIESFDLMILDIGLPGCNGLDVLRLARQEQNPIPTLILTARDTVADRVTGLDVGADDYMIKPFDMGELHARIRSLIRRAGGRATPSLVYEDIEIRPDSRTVKKGGQKESLTTGEYSVLLQLMENQDHVITRQRLKESLYGWGCNDVDSNTVEVHVSHIRRKLGNSLIRTIRGVGYMIEKSK